MNIRRKLAAAAMTAGLAAGALAMASPANATVTWVSCPVKPGYIQVNSNTHPSFCYTGSGEGWANIDSTTSVQSAGPWGHIVDLHSGGRYYYSSYTTTPMPYVWTDRVDLYQ
ncbi:MULTISPECIES: hypothetical protein [Streptomyces]|uniref:Streptomyces killer toxin-like beta/gamma crystallin domain-containing protein n=1 Tax=Streptomyces noboritoensis TaxID=67337 RepID=A0ABV6T9F7_9ACTN|nr:hypothetical protein [Streptomyces melanogenes]GGP84247.1 hypothetical protein GCM10010278_73480 [Streptomyces melanogenes]